MIPPKDLFTETAEVQALLPVIYLLPRMADMLVWGGVAQLYFHGVSSPQADVSGQAPVRINLTFRKAA